MHGTLKDGRGYGIAKSTHSIVRSIPRPTRGKAYSIRRVVDFYAFDAEYVRRLRAREEEVQEHFSLYFAERLRLKLRAARYPTAEIEDIIQETLFRSLEKLPELRDPERLGAFVFGICKNICYEEARRRKPEPLPKDYSQVMQGLDDPQRDFLEAERREALRRAIEKLKPKDRDLLKAIFEERPKEEICRTFGVTPGYLRVCLFRLKKTLKRRFLKKFDEKHPPENHDKDH